MLIELYEIKKRNNGYALEPIFINPQHIIMLTEDLQTKTALLEGKINLGINKAADFTRVKINETNSVSEVVVVGSPKSIQSKIYKRLPNKTLLRG